MSAASASASSFSTSLPPTLRVDLLCCVFHSHSVLGVPSFTFVVVFWSPLALLVVVLSLFSVCDLSHLCAARGLLQAACSSSITSGSRLAPPTPPLSIAPLRDRWFAVGALAPRRRSLLQRGLLSWRTGISVRSLGCFSDPCVSFSRCFSFTCLAEMSLSLCFVACFTASYGAANPLRTVISCDRASCSDVFLLHDRSHCF